MKHPVAVVPKKSQFRIESIWNVLGTLRKDAEGAPVQMAAVSRC